MEGSYLNIPNFDVYLVMGILILFIVLETLAGYFHRTERKAGDWIQELGSFLVLSLLTKPVIVLTVAALCGMLIPQYQLSLQGSSLWLTIPLYVLIDDCMQYWYHRSAHEYSFLWKLHRPHHQAEEMGYFVSYRNAALYYMIMPNIWWIGFFTFIGGGIPVAVGLILKQLVVISSHSTLPYDKWLHKTPILRPLAILIERIFITPAFHHAHHGKSKLDGISDPNANFGNMFSIWDQVFGTAVFNREFPLAYGLMHDPKENWTAAYLYPAVASSDPKSEISRGYSKSETKTMEPIEVPLIKGENYLWCQCGLSQNQPFCDGSHHGTKHKPVLFTAKRTSKARLCNCKLTKTSPFCDDSHLV